MKATRFLLALSLGLFISSWCQPSSSEMTILQGVVLSHDGKPVYMALIYLDPPEGDLPQRTGDWRTDGPDRYSREVGIFTVLKPPLPCLTVRVLKRDDKPLANATIIVTIGFENSELPCSKRSDERRQRRSSMGLCDINDRQQSTTNFGYASNPERVRFNQRARVQRWWRNSR